MRIAAPSNRTSHPAFTSQTCGSLAPPIGCSLHFLATWRKGGVQRSEALGLFIDDACQRGPRIRFELENGRLAETRSTQSDGHNSIWSKIRPAGSYVCSATSRVRAVRH